MSEECILDDAMQVNLQWRLTLSQMKICEGAREGEGREDSRLKIT